jgi:hypothetical protein
MVVLVVVMTVVLLLVARAWKRIEPHSEDVSRGEAVRSDDLPGLEEVRQETDAHTEAVDEAIVVIED